MAITFPITGVAATVTSTRSPSFTLGTSPIENDIIVLFLRCATTSTTTDVSGWTNVLGANTDLEPSDGTLTGMMLYHRVTAAEDTADTVTWTLTNLFNAAESGHALATVLRGVATSGELVGTGTDSSASAVEGNLAAITPTADNCQIIAGFAQDAASTGLTTGPAGHTLLATQNVGAWLYARDSLGSNGVPIGTTAIDVVTTDEFVAISAAFAPAGPTSHPVTGSGSTTTDGSVAINVERPLTASGSVTIDGSAAINIPTGAVEHPITASGATTTTGTATLRLTSDWSDPASVLPITASGATTTTGSAAISRAHPLTFGAPVSDDFNRANGGLGANWTTLENAPQITSNQVTAVSSNLDYIAGWSANTFNADHFAEADMTWGVGDSPAAGVWVRASTTSGYVLTWRSGVGLDGEWVLERFDGPTLWTDLDVITGVGRSGTHRFRIEVIGTTIKGYVDGVERLSAVDTTHATGSPGINVYRGTGDTSIALDNFSAGTFNRVTVTGSAAIDISTGATSHPITASGATTTTGSAAISCAHSLTVKGFLDDFTRADGVLGTDWTATNWSIVTNSARSSVANNTAVWVDTLPDDQFVEADGDIVNDGVGVIARWTDANNFYMARWVISDAGRYQLFKVVGGVFTTIGTSVTGVGTTGVRNLRLNCVGTQITFYVNGVQQITVSDAAHASGRAGLWSDGANEILDSFRAGGLPYNTVTVTGSAAIDITTGPTSHPLTASGSTTIDGSAVINVVRPITASGSTTTTGSAIVNATRPLTFGAPFADDFNRANQTLDTSPNWMEIGSNDHTIVSNQLSSAFSGGCDAVTTFDISDGTKDLFAEVSVAGSNSAGYVGFFVDTSYVWNVSGNGYALRFVASQTYITITKITGGAIADLAQSATGYNTGNFRFERVQSTGLMTVYYETTPGVWTNILQHTDTAHSTVRRPWVSINNISTDYDNIRFGVLPENRVSITGSAAIGRAHSLTASGSTTTDGSAAIDIGTGPTSHALTASGSATTDGTANILVERPLTASGATTTTGTAAIQIPRPLTASGTTTTTGTAAIQIPRPLTASGATTTTGTAAIQIPRPLTASGATTTTGSAAIQIPRLLTASGSTTTTGSAAIQIPRPLTASGSTTTTGSAATNVTRPVTASGSATTTGSAAIEIVSPQTWAGSSAVVEVNAFSGSFVDQGGPQTWAGNAVAVRFVADSGAFVGGAATWGGTAAAIEIVGASGEFFGGATWVGSTAAITVAASSGSFVPGTATWVGNPTAITISAASGAFIDNGAPQTWAGNAAAVTMAATSGSFVPGTAAWVGSTAAVTVAASSGSFAPGTTTWVGSTAAVQVVATSGAFVGGAATWAGTAASVEVVALSGNFVDEGGPQTWVGGSTATVTLSAASGSFVAGPVTWVGTGAAADVVAQSGSFTVGGAPQTWTGSGAAITLTALSGSWSAEATWVGTAAVAIVSASSGSFVGGPANWAGSAADLTVQASSGDFAPGGAIWVGSAAAATVAAVSGPFSAGPVAWVGTTAVVSIAGSSGSFSGGPATWVGTAAFIEVAAASGIIIQGGLILSGEPLTLKRADLQRTIDSLDADREIVSLDAHRTIDRRVE